MVIAATDFFLTIPEADQKNNPTRKAGQVITFPLCRYSHPKKCGCCDRSALQPDGLTTFENALRALNEAVDDVRLAGRQAANCPAVPLLTRHLQRIADGRPTECEADDQALRSQCIERLAELKHRPAIIALVKRGIDYRPEELRHYRREGTRALRQIAAGIGLEHANDRVVFEVFWLNLDGQAPSEALR